jgi:peptidylprolyl isomerase
MKKVLFILTILGGLLMSENASAESLKMTLKDGEVIIKLLPEVAPNHVARIKELTKEGFYDGIVFHRVIDGFMAQTGDPTGTGMGGSDKGNIDAEFNDTKFNRGTIGMARSQMPDSANSQFFICFKPSYFLNGQYTVWGEVTSGMEFVDSIKKGEPPVDPDKIIKMELID